MPANPFVLQIVGAFMRLLLGGVATWLIEHGIVTADDWTQILAGLSVALVTLAWSVYSKYHGRLKLVTALATPSRMSEREVEELIVNAQRWGGKLPPVSTPKDLPPAA